MSVCMTNEWIVWIENDFYIKVYFVFNNHFLKNLQKIDVIFSQMIDVFNDFIVIAIECVVKIMSNTWKTRNQTKSCLFNGYMFWCQLSMLSQINWNIHFKHLFI